MQPTWSDIGKLLACGFDASFEAELVVRTPTSPAPPIRLWVMDDPRANLHADSGRTGFVRAGRTQARLDHPDGRRTLFDDGQVWQIADDDTATMFRVRSLNASGYAALLIDQPDNAEEALGYGFPSGEIRLSTHQDRPVAVMAGDAGYGFGAIEISVDLDTGLLVRVAASDDSWEARLENLQVKQLVDSTFRWAGHSEPPGPIQPRAEWVPAQFTEQLTPVSDPAPLATDPRARRMRARLDEIVIADGQLSPPRVGDTIEVHLTFFDDPSPMKAEPVEVRAMAEPIGQGTPREDRHGVLRWPTILRGDGWTAKWFAPRPTIGHVLVSGHFAVIHDAAAAAWITPTRAAVAGIRVNRLTGPMPADPESEPLPGNAWSDEPVCPNGFARHMVQHNAERPAQAIAVALDLDLDAAELPRVRSEFEPGELSVVDGELWIGDRFRPILQKRSGSSSGSAEEHLLPLPVGPFTRSVTPHAGQGGIWIEHQHKLWSVEVTAGAPARLHDLGTVRWGAAVAFGNHLVTSGNPLRRFTAHGEDDPITLPPEVGYVGSIARAGDGLVVLGSEPRNDDDDNVGPDGTWTRDDGALRFRLALHRAGRWLVGESFGLPVPATSVWGTRDGFRVLCVDLLLHFNNSLERGTVDRLPYSPRAGGSTATGMWLTFRADQIALELRDPEAPDPWHLRGRLGDLGPRGEFHRGLLVRLNDDLDPTVIVLTDSPAPSVAVTSDDVVWFSGQSLRGITADGQLTVD